MKLLAALAALALAGCRTDGGIGFAPYAEGTYLTFAGDDGAAATAGVQLLPPAADPFPDGLNPDRVAARHAALERDIAEARAVAAEYANIATAWASWATSTEPPDDPGDSPGSPAGGPARDDTEPPEPAAEPAATDSDPPAAAKDPWVGRIEALGAALLGVLGVLGFQRGRRMVAERKGKEA